ncbi:ABC transporter substrate-binding protein [Myxococcus sp. CA051A]|uniref:TAXI family TRAP transporter solute-binding subunit n=1 Tax=unclassified Myxococcus TaxID=2648731 RepID=UPI00157AD0EC|nr:MULTISPECIES: TAXI family TRAP transporter solute-binding subunit [unclassified Myxococcus]NTX12840.1 ABC transporter substrate-binding protein [Myxococcus sp. CA056]NTX56831.1 ABC transporter substrate-binding protein [Myxococcus sp. CA039A]NTX66417.1 ABC transporter substrate-binding protein [Myxococcus sp. CA051A]
MTADSLKQQLRRTLRRDLWFTLAPAVLLIGIAFAAAFHFIEPAPPKKLVLALSPDEGGFRYYARKYQDFLSKHGVTLELRSTKGSIENVALLSDENSDVDVAFVQSGTAGGEKAASVVSLGSLSYVPLWVFYRGEPLEDVRQLKGRRIAVGPEGSGTRALAVTLLKANGIDQAPTELLPLEREAAIEQLKQGHLDAIFLISPAESPPIQKLAAVPGVNLLSFARGEAYARRFPYLTRLVLPRGVFNLASDIPARDVVVLAPTANLVARDSLHPALSYLLMRAASQIHGSAGLLDGASEFPAPRETGFALSSEARRYYEAGIPLLQRYLPFWAANLVDRLWVMLVPIIAVVVPLFRAVPALYQWRIRSRIVRWYARLKEIEIQLDENPGRDMLEDMLKRLEEAEREVNRIPMPLAYAENLYFFREHIEVVRRRLIRRLDGARDGVGALVRSANA